jgi:cytochrome c peroxidase
VHRSRQRTAATCPLFTDFSYDNLGLPRNLNIPGNPESDPGLGGRSDIAARDPDGQELGKHKVMGLRNIAVTAPYMHHGVLATLADVVHFHNTRDSKPRTCRDTNDAGFGEDCWPAPEVARCITEAG